MYKRLISLPKNSSFFLFGQRGTGKSSFLNAFFGKNALIINLLDSKQFIPLNTAPWKLRELVLAKRPEQDLVVIDEIQKIPALLDEVHLLIEEHKINFALTGSSARKLKRAGVNLLAGRALTYRLFPLTHIELGDDFNLNTILHYGALPKAVCESDSNLRIEYLYSYVDTYLKEEIILEQAVRNLEPFTKFLAVAAQTHGNTVNYDRVAKDTGVTPVTIKTYFEILTDTLLAFYLPAYHTSIRRRQKIAPKFYFYDIGLVRTLLNTVTLDPIPSTFEYGTLFEGFVINEILRLNEYKRTRFEFSHLRIDDNDEVDLIIERPGKPTVLIEIKSRTDVTEDHCQILQRLSPSFKDSKLLCLHTGSDRKKIKDVLCLNWKDGIQEIFEGTSK